MAKFAEGTVVAPEKSRAEIERLLTRYGAERFASGWDADGASLMFDYRGRRVRFSLPLPKPIAGTPAKPPPGWWSWGETKRNAWRQSTADAESRRRWRALALVIKAKLEVVESQISTFDQEFLAHFVLPSGETFADWAVPYLDKIGERMPPLLPGAS